MTLILDDLLVQLTDFSNFRDISVNTDADRLNAYIREAQLREMRSFLGDALYNALLSDYTPGVSPAEGTFTQARFTELWFGTTYTSGNYPIKYHGLKPAVVYYAYERFLFYQRLNVTRYGSRILEDNELSVDAPLTKRWEVSADSMGLVYQNDSNTFLDAKTSTYPEWQQPDGRVPEKIGFKFMKVGRTLGR